MDFEFDYYDCTDYKLHPFRKFTIYHPERLEELQQAYGVLVTYTLEELYDLFSKDFKTACQALIPKAQSKKIMDVDVGMSCAWHDVNFNFSNEGRELNFSVFQPFKGQTDKLILTEGNVLTGEATTRYHADVTISNTNGAIVAQDEAIFYVN
jgi:hypothetical protein